MSATSRARRVSRRIALFAVLLATAAWFVLYGGRFLDHENPLTRSDAIFVLAGARVERWLEAVDLYRSGYASEIVLSPGDLQSGEIRLRQLGVRFPRESELAREAMLQLRVPAAAISTFDESVDNTAQEAALLRRVAARHGWHRVIIVTSKYHTRRAGFAFRRALRGSGIQVLIHATRYDASDPAHWWQHRADCRWILEEWQKLIAYWCGLSE